MATTKKKRGRGRPALPKAQRKGTLVSIRGTAAEVDAWTKAAKDLPLSTWGRDAMNEKARRSK